MKFTCWQECAVAARTVIFIRAQTGVRDVEEVGTDRGDAGASVQTRIRQTRVCILTVVSHPSVRALAKVADAFIRASAAVFTWSPYAAI